MESNTHRKKTSKFDDFKDGIALRVETISQKIGTAITCYCVSFVVLPTLIAVTLLILNFLAPSPPNPAQKGVPSVKEMFVAVKQHPVSIHRYAEEWWEDSCYDPQNTRQSAHVIIMSQHSILGRKMQREILRLHKKIIQLKTRDPIHHSSITYKDVCMKPLSIDLNDPRNQTADCASETIIKMFSCMKSYKFLSLNLRMDSSTKTLWGIMHQEGRFNASLFLPGDLWCRNQVGREVFFGQTICMVDDHMHSEAISAGCLRLNYYLKDLSRSDNIKANFWLQNFEATLLKFQSDLMNVTVVSSETLNSQWWNLVRLTVINGVVLGVIYFAIALALVSKIGNIIHAIYLSLCAVASFAMTVISMYFLHSVLYETPRFNMGFCVIIVSVVHFVFLLVFMECYFQTHDHKQLRGQAHSTDCFIECYRNSLIPNFGFLFLFSSVFGIAAIHDSLLSFRALCLTSCIGYAVAFFYQGTLYPACLFMYNSRIHNVVEKFRFHMATVNQEPLEYSISESVFLDGDTITNGTQNNTSASEKDNSKSIRKRKRQKFTSKLEKLYHRFTVYVVCDHMRAVCALLYLTYLSLSCVGTVHFTEGITPKLLVSQSKDDFKQDNTSVPTNMCTLNNRDRLMFLKLLQTNSKAYDYFTSEEYYFKPYGPRFVVYGTLHGYPWEDRVVKQLYEIHKSLMEMRTIDSNLSVNWFQHFFRYSINSFCTACVNPDVLVSKKSDLEHRRHHKRSTELVQNPFKNGREFPFKNLTSLWKAKESASWNSASIDLPDYFWSGFDWYSSWNNFSKTAIYQNYKKDIEFVVSTSESAHLESLAEDIQVRFRWIYYTINSNLPSRQDELITRFEEILKQADNSIMTMLVFDAPELDWWTSVRANRFLHCFTSLVVFGLVLAIFLIIWIKRGLVVIWSCVIVVSVCFGIVGFLSLSGIRSDPISIPCVLFAIPCTIFVTLKFLATFFDHLGGRADSAAASLRKSGSRSMLFCAQLFFSCLTLASRSSYVYKAPSSGLFLLVIFLLLHAFFITPFLLTVFPPQKKKKLVAKKKPIVKQCQSKKVLNEESGKLNERNSISNLNQQPETIDHITLAI